MQPRSSAPHTLAERLNVEKERIEAELRKTNPGPRRGELERKLRQLDTASHINEWASSPGLQAPK
jgi:hypothetical protein